LILQAREKKGQTSPGILWEKCPRCPLALRAPCFLASVYAGPSATIRVQPASFHAQTNIYKHQYKTTLSSHLVGNSGRCGAVEQRRSGSAAEWWSGSSACTVAAVRAARAGRGVAGRVAVRARSGGVVRGRKRGVGCHRTRADTVVASSGLSATGLTHAFPSK
jgi:hypothetical protein